MRIASLKQLTLARFREFTREPEAVFWTFVFPLLLAGGLAIAFRDKAPEQSIVAVVMPVTPDSVALRVGSVQGVLPTLLSMAAQCSIVWSELSTHSATLEDVFVALTGRDLRDG